MAVVLHVIDGRAANGAVVADDIRALDGVDDIAHLALPLDDDDGVLAPTIAAMTLVRRRLRELRVRHDVVAVHAHGPIAWRVAAICADVVVVDDADERSEHRLLPPPRRRVFSCHADLDRGLDRGVPQRQAALAPPGVDVADAVAGADAAVVVAGGVTVTHVDTALSRAGVAVLGTDADGTRVVVGALTPLSPRIASAIAAGGPVFSLGAQWMDEFHGYRALIEVSDLDELVTAVTTVRQQRRRRLPKSLGRAARSQELADIYASVVGPARLRARIPR